jgi:hypothetical protein
VKSIGDVYPRARVGRMKPCHSKKSAVSSRTNPSPCRTCRAIYGSQLRMSCEKTSVLLLTPLSGSEMAGRPAPCSITSPSRAIRRSMIKLWILLQTTTVKAAFRRVHRIGDQRMPVRCRTSIVMSGLFEPPPSREVGELSARPLGFYTVSLAKRCYSIALRYTDSKGYSQSSILISPSIP